MAARLSILLGKNCCHRLLHGRAHRLPCGVARPRAAQHNRNITIHLYPGAGHGFFNPARATYDPQAVELASERIGDMLAPLRAADSR
jgi:hypothetical protein